MIQRIATLLLLALLTTGLHAQWNWDKFKKKAEEALSDSKGGGLTEDQIIQGLREALNVGAVNATDKASQVNGFLQNPAIKIPFPPEVRKVEATLRGMGMNKQVDKFIESMNHAAENAAKQAKPIFVSAVKGITIRDGLSILNGGETAATTYLSSKTSHQLEKVFQPEIAQALKKTSTTALWNDLITVYNRLPMVKKLNPNLEEYVTEKAVDGIFHLVGEEERKIRKDPSARISEILETVFGGK